MWNFPDLSGGYWFKTGNLHVVIVKSGLGGVYCM